MIFTEMAYTVVDCSVEMDHFQHIPDMILETLISWEMPQYQFMFVVCMLMYQL